MPIDPEFVGLLQILLGVVSLFFLKPASDNRDRAGSRSFAVLCVGIGVYGVSAGLDRFVSSYALSHFVFTFRSLGGVLITTAWLLLALAVTDRIEVTRRVRTGLAAYVVAIQLFFWSDPVHNLVVGPGSTMNGADFDPNIGVGLWAVLGVGYLWTFVGTGLLATDALRSTGIRRGQRGRVVVLRDITDRKRREQELERQNERLDRFASMVGHDLRNPLTVAAGQLALAEGKCESDAVREHLGAVERSHERMDAMVEDLLTLARSGQRVEETESIGLATVVREAWTHTEVADSDLDPAVPDDVTIAADTNRLLHVFENCFRNAADHNDAPLTVRVGLLDGGRDDRVGFFIEDDGKGIPAPDRDRVFDHGYTTGADGTGLGLFIVKDIIDAHGWDVRVTEGTDGGARFEVTGVDRGDR